MTIDDDFPEDPYPPNPARPPFLSPDNIIAVYTTLVLLRRMRRQLGMEAMLEYMDAYLTMIEKTNPRLRKVVALILSSMNLDAMYKEATYGEKQ